jgi:Zinc finger, C3HC4 type (RING finger)
MSSCEGRGTCFQQCCCVCYEDEECDIPSDVCSCGHRNSHIQFIGGTTECDIYCQKECPHNCQLVECYNFRLCGIKEPQECLDLFNEMCSECAMMIGKIKFLDEKNDCPICMENKDMIEISCGNHKVCIDCWKNWSETSTQFPLTCPLCRNPIWKLKVPV